MSYGRSFPCPELGMDAETCMDPLQWHSPSTPCPRRRVSWSWTIYITCHMSPVKAHCTRRCRNGTASEATNSGAIGMPYDMQSIRMQTSGPLRLTHDDRNIYIYSCGPWPRSVIFFYVCLCFAEAWRLWRSFRRSHQTLCRNTSCGEWGAAKRGWRNPLGALTMNPFLGFPVSIGQVCIAGFRKKIHTSLVSEGLVRSAV